MPKFDGTGPRGQGPGTGRGRGYCRSGYQRQNGRGRGPGLGRGQGRRFWGSSYVTPALRANQPGYGSLPQIYSNPQGELADLQVQEKLLTQELKEIRNRIAAVESLSGSSIAA
ncbi:MAG: hypothetical protein BZ151_10735 [Desulfobacca sp. 4484_104]|nr:MAG: hypothetical protein BZ151_10735 [Desulfobacca sp. 4484_104]RLA90757.1 MAG: hypothetical protein DRG58_01055 [Deltaproteobacteria bacterium]